MAGEVAEAVEAAEAGGVDVVEAWTASCTSRVKFHVAIADCA